jgi:hypothetical protein
MAGARVLDHRVGGDPGVHARDRRVGQHERRARRAPDRQLADDRDPRRVRQHELERRRGAVHGRAAAAAVAPSTLELALAVYAALTSPGDTIAVLPDWAGGHLSHHEVGAPGIRGLRVAPLPYDADVLDVDLETLDAFLGVEAPRLVVVGASLMLFAHRLPEIARVARARGIPLLYDASHVAGLVAERRFQDPLREGADLMTFSTYKSFGGPPGGAIVTNDEELARRVSDAVYPSLVANYDVSRLVPLAAAAVECELETTVDDDYDGYRFHRDEPVFALAWQALERAGFEPQPVEVGGGSDANVFNARGVPCVNIANGMADVHTPDEHIAVSDLDALVHVTLELVAAARSA